MKGKSNSLVSISGLVSESVGFDKTPFLYKGSMVRKGTIFLLIGIVLLSAGYCHAVPVFGKIFDLRQPDGSTIKVRVWGDEFYSVVESLDGYTLIRDPLSQEICYAELSADNNELVSTSISASRYLPVSIQIKPHVRINKAALEAKIREARRNYTDNRIELFTDIDLVPPASKQNLRGICILIDFIDEPNTIPPSELNDLCNMEGYTGYENNGSVRDYFHDVSGDHHLIYTNYVTTVYYRASKNKEYYDKDPNSEYKIRARELVVEALNWLENIPEGFDFSDYDSNYDKRIDAINCFYSGTFTPVDGEDGLWPHRGQCDPSDPNASFSADGVSFYYYQISDALIAGWFVEYSPC